MRSSEKQYTFQTIIEQGSQIREFVESQMRHAAVKMVYELFNQEVESICGNRFSRKVEGQCHRGGSGPGTQVIHGRRVSLPKFFSKAIVASALHLTVENALVKIGSDINLEPYEAHQNYGLFCDRVIGLM